MNRVPVVAFFNNKGGVGKTSLVFHLAWMMSRLGLQVLAADLDPQANLTSVCIDEDALSLIWNDESEAATVYSALQPLIKGVGDVTAVRTTQVAPRLSLVPGDLRLSLFEDSLSDAWPRCLSSDERSFRVTSALWRCIQKAAQSQSASVILVDLGPNLGAINRAALVSSDWVVVPLAPDLYSLQGLRNLGPKLRGWRADWRDRLEKASGLHDLVLPRGDIRPVGYVVLQHAERLNRPVQAYVKWMDRIPTTYHDAVMDDPLFNGTDVHTDSECLALLKHFRSLMPMAQEARKPIFELQPADGAIGAHVAAVKNAYQDFERLTLNVLSRIGVSPRVSQ